MIVPPEKPLEPYVPPAIMNHRPHLPAHSFRLMLYLEWILLGITLLGELRPTRHSLGAVDLSLSLIPLIGFGLMGLKLPTGKPMSTKILYTGLEFGLLLATFFLDRRPVFLPLPGLIIVIRSCLIFPQVGRFIVTGLVFASFLPLLLQQGPPHHPRHPGPVPDAFASTLLTLRINSAITFGLALLFILLLVNALLAERQSREKLLHAHEQLRHYALRIEDQATLQERNRIAREIHDALGHVLTAQSIQLENALLFLPPEADKTASFLHQARQLGTSALQEVRRSVSTLRADPLRGQPLDLAIAQAMQQFHQSTGILPEATIHLTHPLPTEVRAALYRIVQESLTNSYKHGEATQIYLQLETRNGTIHLDIADNGQGFDPGQNTTGFGLQGMRERTTALGGQFSVVSQPGQGCRITVLIPSPGVTL